MLKATFLAKTLVKSVLRSYARRHLRRQLRKLQPSEMLSKLLVKTAQSQPRLVRHVGVIRNAWNEVDGERLCRVGPERLCAEWMLKNDGQVRLFGHRPPPSATTSGTNLAAASAAAAGASCSASCSPRFLHDLGQLPPEQTPVHVFELDARGSTVSDNGFAHLEHCKCVRRIVLEECDFVTDEALEWLCSVRRSLRQLEIANCPGIEECGLLQLGRLELDELRIECMYGIRDIEKVRATLSELLPRNCNLVVRDYKKEED